MKAYSLTKIITFVSILFVACVGFAQAPSGQPIFGSQYSPAQDCSAAINRTKDLYSKAFAACRGIEGSTIAKCVKTMGDCEDNLDDENPIMLPSGGTDNPLLSQFFNLEGGSANSCSDYGRTDYNSELKDYKREKKDSKKTLLDAQKQLARDQEDYNEKAAKIKERITTAKSEKAVADLEFKEAQRQEEETNEKSLNDIKKEIRDTQGSILNFQQQRLAKIAARKLDIDSYQIKILECKLKIDKIVEDRSKVKKTSGRLNNLASSGGTNNKELKTIWETCVTNVINERTAKGQAYDSEIVIIDQGMADLNVRLNELMASKSAQEQRISQAKLDRQNAKNEKDANDKENYLNLLQEAAEAEKVANLKINQTKKEIQSADRDLYESSNDLVDFQKYKPKGKKSLSENYESATAYTSAVAACEAMCSAATLGGASRAASCSQTSAGSSSSSSPNGKQ